MLDARNRLTCKTAKVTTNKCFIPIFSLEDKPHLSSPDSKSSTKPGQKWKAHFISNPLVCVASEGMQMETKG